jgi:hypothetical protein
VRKNNTMPRAREKMLLRASKSLMSFGSLMSFWSFASLRSLLPLCLLLTIGCATPSGPKIERQISQSLPARRPDYPILITTGQYADPSIEIAAVTTQAYDDRLVDDLGKAELRRIARSLGGDAVVRLTQNGVFEEEGRHKRWPFYKFGFPVENKLSLTGIVIRFKREGKE